MVDIDLGCDCENLARVFVKPFTCSDYAISWIGVARLDSARQHEHFLTCRLTVIVEILLEIPVLLVEEFFPIASIDKKAVATDPIKCVWHLTAAKVAMIGIKLIVPAVLIEAARMCPECGSAEQCDWDQ